MILGQWIRVGGLYHSERDKDGLPFLYVTKSSGADWAALIASQGLKSIPKKKFSEHSKCSGDEWDEVNLK